MSLALQTGANSAVFDHERDRLAVRPRRDLEPDGSFSEWGMDTDWGATGLFRNISLRRRAQTRWLDERSKRKARRRHDVGISQTRDTAISNGNRAGFDTSKETVLVAANSAGAVRSERRSWSFASDWTLSGRDLNSRRTVTITGRPDPVPAVFCTQRARSRRPASIQDRIASRPDRIAGWAFGLGLLLILISVATAHAA